jgi:hypothetical protein
MQLGSTVNHQSAVFSNDGRQFAVERIDGTVIADLQSRKVRVLPRNAPVVALRFSPDGKRLLQAKRNGSLSTVEIGTWVTTRVLKTKGASRGWFSAGARYFAERLWSDRPLRRCGRKKAHCAFERSKNFGNRLPLSELFNYPWVSAPTVLCSPLASMTTPRGCGHDDKGECCEYVTRGANPLIFDSWRAAS